MFEKASIHGHYPAFLSFGDVQPMKGKGLDLDRKVIVSSMSLLFTARPRMTLRCTQTLIASK
jgi:hypothetical protein